MENNFDKLEEQVQNPENPTSETEELLRSPQVMNESSVEAEQEITICPEPTTTKEADFEEHIEGPKEEPKVGPGEGNVHGWFAFFLFTVGAGGLVSFISIISGLSASDYSNSFYLWVDAFLGIGLLALAAYAIYSAIKKKPGAIFLLKVYLIIIFLSNLLLLVSGNYTTDGVLGSLPQLLRSLVWGVIWFCYLLFSDQVADIFPKAYRKKTKVDKYLVTAVIGLPLLCFVLGVCSDIIRVAKTQGIAEVESLPSNKRSDGVIIFDVPEGYLCNEIVTADNAKYFELFTSDSLATITVMSAFDEALTRERFDMHWDDWNSWELTDEYFDSVNIRELSYGSSYGWQKNCVMNYDDIEWAYAVVYHPGTQKVVVVSEWRSLEVASAMNKVTTSLVFE